jgi:hypothetical protein
MRTTADALMACTGAIAVTVTDGATTITASRAAEYLQTIPAALLAAVVRGEIDLNLVASEQLAARGLDASGAWVGFPAANAAHAVRLAAADAPAPEESAPECPFHATPVDVCGWCHPRRTK